MSTQTEPMKHRALDPCQELRTIPAGWDLSGFYTLAENWVNEPQHDRSAANSWKDNADTAHDTTEDTV